MSSSQNRRQMMQPWPLCLISLGKTKERAILPKYYTRVPSIARSTTASSSLAQDCSSNATLLTNVSPFNSQVALIADKHPPTTSTSASSGHHHEVEVVSKLAEQPQIAEAKGTGQQQQHYYAENLRNNHHKALNGSQIYHPLRKDREIEDYRQLDPLLRKDESASDTKTLMESQDLKTIEAATRLAVPQFEKEIRIRRGTYWTQLRNRTKKAKMKILMRADTHVNIEVPGNAPVAKCTFSQVLAAFSVSLGSMVVGFASSYTSPAFATLSDRNFTPFDVSKDTVSWIGSIMPLSALFGGIAGGPLIEYVGRRNTILFTAFPFILAWLLIGCAFDVAMVLVGRALSGFCVGIASLSLPVYLGETIQPEVRGSLGLLPTAFGNIGILLCFVTGMYLNWWKLALFGAILPVPFALLMFMIPETPRWYISKGKTKRARRSLQWLRGRHADVSEELTMVEKMHVESERQATQSAFSELFRGSNFKPLLISLGLMFFQQMSGINAVIFYTVQIFEMAGSTIDSNLSTIIIGIVNFASTFVATALIDRLGRKILLYMSSVCMIISLMTLGGYMYMEKFGNAIIQGFGWIPLTSFVIYVIGFSLGFGPIPWLMMGEILPAKIRGSAASVVTSFNWSCTFIVTKTFTDILVILGSYGTFWLFGSICVAGLVFVFCFVPETSGRSLEEIERGLTGPVRRMSAVANMKPTPMAC